jgi:hypothetical protein|mmetsp:Transcript_357/g.43  ORF Transcript_357/g.43 Transcript_357/m.43 type:complete len:97 (+) Transcript_357:830-1120(+)
MSLKFSSSEFLTLLCQKNPALIQKNSKVRLTMGNKFFDLVKLTYDINDTPENVDEAETEKYIEGTLRLLSKYLQRTSDKSIVQTILDLAETYYSEV